MKRIYFQKKNLCSGCLSCQTVCSMAQSDACHPESACVRIDLQPFSGNHGATVCRQCSDALCAKNCPTQAIKFQEGRKYWYIDYNICITCRTCMKHCPYGALFYDEIHYKVIKCDTCDGDFRCVEACKFDVLECSDE